jgi:hypothetical protein
MWIGERIEVNCPNVAWRLLHGKEWYRELFGVSAGHGGDEFGNCSVYFSCVLFSVVVFPGLCFQREVLLPEPGEHPFIDAMYYTPEDVAEWVAFSAPAEPAE